MNDDWEVRGLPGDSLPVGEILLAIGAWGTVAFGIVEGMKWTALGTSGFPQIPKFLGAALMEAITNTYGAESRELLIALYRDEQTNISTWLRQGIRFGMRPDNAEEMAVQVGVVNPDSLVVVAEKITSGVELTAFDKFVLDRFELAVDARINAALARAVQVHRTIIRSTATTISICLALLFAWLMADGWAFINWKIALLVGIVAVPLAPVAERVSKALQSVAAGTHAKE